MIDEFGRYLPVPDRFTNASFASMCGKIDKVLLGKAQRVDLYYMEFAVGLQRGLQCGVHVVAGVSRLAVQRATPVFGSCR